MERKKDSKERVAERWRGYSSVGEDETMEEGKKEKA
jgi:hypothetical protein